MKWEEYAHKKNWISKLIHNESSKFPIEKSAFLLLYWTLAHLQSTKIDLTKSNLSSKYSGIECNNRDNFI
jgi:hypothetical protein